MGDSSDSSVSVPSSGAPTDSATTSPAASAPAAKTGKTGKTKRAMKPRHSATNQLNDFYALRDEAHLVDDALVKADLSTANEAARRLEKESNAMPGFKAGVAEAKTDRQDALVRLDICATLVSTALKLCAHGQEIIDACADKRPQVAAESLLRRVSADLLGPNQVVVGELHTSFGHFRRCEERITQKESELSQASARYNAASKRLKGCASRLRNSLRYYQARQRAALME